MPAALLVSAEILAAKRREVVRAHRTEVIAFRSELLSLHCPRHPLLRALLPACADPQVFTRQDCPAYAGEPLHTVGLLEAAHQYSLQDMCGSTRTPIPASLSTQEWQFKNLHILIQCMTAALCWRAAGDGADNLWSRV